VSEDRRNNTAVLICTQAGRYLEHGKVPEVYLQYLAVIWIRPKERRQATSKEPSSSQPLPALNRSRAARGLSVGGRLSSGL